MVTLVTRFGGYVFSSVATVACFSGLLIVSQFLQRFYAVVCECYGGLSCDGHVVLTWREAAQPEQTNTTFERLRNFRRM
jgi:hypothetical protein